MFSLVVCVVLLIVAIILHFWQMRRFYFASFEIKGPTALPLLGNCFDIMGNSDDILERFTRIKRTYGTVFRLWIGTRFFVCLGNPEDISVVLNHPCALHKGKSYQFFYPIIGQGLLSCKDVSKWRQHRKLIAPNFNSIFLAGFIPIFEEQSLILCEKLLEFVGASIFDLESLLARCHLDIICETAMSVEINAQSRESEYLHWFKRLCAIAYKRIVSVWYYPDVIFARTKLGKEQENVLGNFKRFNANVFEKKRADYKHNKMGKAERSVKRKAFLDYLLEISEETGALTDEQISDEVATFIVAGSETTSTTDLFVLMMLGMHQEIQEKVFEELQEIFGGNDRRIVAEDLAKMKYLEMVIKETLRLFPPGCVVARSITKDIQLKSCTIPMGSGCLLGIYHMHRDPELWTDPLKFDPDRFLPEEVAKRHPYSWIPFSGGPRNCIGLKYAMMAMKVLLSTVLRKYRVYCGYSSIDEIKIRADIVLKLAGSPKVSLETRLSRN